VNTPNTKISHVSQPCFQRIKQILGVVEIILGIMCFSFDVSRIIQYKVPEGSRYYGNIEIFRALGIYCAIFFIGTGIFAFISGYKSTKCYTITSLALSIICGGFVIFICLPLFSVAIIQLNFSSYRGSTHSRNLIETLTHLTAAMLATAVFQGIIVLAQAILECCACCACGPQQRQNRDDLLATGHIVYLRE